MSDETPAPKPTAQKPIDWRKIGSPSCDTGAQTEALRAMGLDATAQPINGSAPDFREITKNLPQLLARDATGKLVWNPEIDVATFKTVKGKPGADGKPALKDKMTASTPDHQVNYTEIEAAVIYAAQVALKKGILLKDVKIEDIVDGMCEPLNKIAGNALPVCKKQPLNLG